MAKYDSNTKRKRNALVIVYAQQHSELSLKEVGDIFGISKQRVWAILKEGDHNTQLPQRKNKERSY